MDELLARRALRRFRAEGIGIGPDGRFVLLARKKPCHGFQNGCICGCKPEPDKPKAIKQPWQIAA